ncbi:MAG TPA: MMPL family transporter [Stellaceae bacterium]|jgi:predicted exporter
MLVRRGALGLWLLIAVLAIAVVARTQLRADMAAFLPRSSTEAQQVLIEQASSGASSRIVLLAIEGVPPATLIPLSKALAAHLKQDAAFADVLNGNEASSGMRDFVWTNRYLISDVTAEQFTAAGLRAALLNDLGLLGSDMAPLLQQTMPGDPTGEIVKLLSRLAGPSGPHTSGGIWLSSDESRAVLMIHTRAAGFDIDAEDRALARIHAAFDDARREVPDASPARLAETGPVVFAVGTRDTTVNDAKRLSILATAIIAGLLAFAYRSPLVLLLGLLPVASGALAAIAGVSLAFGFVHGITLGFGVTLLGESVDYAIYLFTQTIRGDPPQATITRIWPTLRLCALTSIVGFAVMLFSDFIGFAQLGLFSIIGLIAAIGTTRFILPLLMPQAFFATGAEFVGRWLAAAMLYRAWLRPLIVVMTFAAAAALGLHRGGFWDGDLTNLSPIPAPMQTLDRTLRSDLGVPDLRYFVVVRADTEQSALEASETLAGRLQTLVTQGRIGGYDVPSAILPSEHTQKARQAALPDGETLRARFNEALTGLPFRADLFEPFFGDVARARSSPLLTLASLPSALALRVDSMLVQRDNGWELIAPLYKVADPAGVAATLAGAGLQAAQLIDMQQESAQLLLQFQHEAVSLAVIGSIAIVALLWLFLRSLTRVAAVTAPLAAALVITAALLTFGGGKLSIFMMVGFLLTVAVGSNYCLFFERAYHDAETQKRSIASIVLANLCTVSAYGIMTLSSIPVLHDIGMTVAAGTFLSMLFAAFLSAGRIVPEAVGQNRPRSGRT